MSDQHVKHICKKLQKMNDGMILMGMNSPILRQAISKIKAQSIALDIYRNQTSYKNGYDAGREEAFATGLVGDEEEAKDD